MAKELQNLVRFNEFKPNWTPETFPTKTARTEVGKDVLAKDMQGADVTKRTVIDKSTTTSNGLAKNVVDQKSGGDVFLNKSTMPDMTSSKTKRTDVAKDVLKEDKEYANMIGFNAFVNNWKPETYPKTARTEVGKDVLARDMKGADADIKKVTDKSVKGSNGLAKNVVDQKKGADVLLNKSIIPNGSASKSKRTDVAKDIL